jgi:hypothetical protein
MKLEIDIEQLLTHGPAVSVMHGAVSFPTSKAVALFLNATPADMVHGVGRDRSGE